MQSTYTSNIPPLMNFNQDKQRCKLILDQLRSERTFTEEEFNVFCIMVSLNEKNCASLSAPDMMKKHQVALDYIVENA